MYYHSRYITLTICDVGVFFFNLSPKLNLVNTTGDCPTYRVQRHSAVTCGRILVVNSFPKGITPRPGFEPQTLG